MDWGHNAVLQPTDDTNGSEIVLSAFTAYLVWAYMLYKTLMKLPPIPILSFL